MATPGLAQSRDFDVPAREATQSIPEFARQAGIQIVASGEQLRGVKTRPVKGQMDARAALAMMLEGTGLVIASDNGNIITLRKAVRESGAGTGAVTGRILDPVTGEYLRNARIQFHTEDRTRLITSGDGGVYFAPDLPTGKVDVTVSFTGFPDRKSSINVRAGETVTLDFDMVRASQEDVHEVVVVASVRDGDARAIMSQRESMDIKNSLSSESYGDISEGNPGEFIKFMPGVDTDSLGDGTVRTVQLRGLPPEYTSVTLNGISLAAADGNTGADASRSFSFEQMSLSAIDSIEVSKTISADVDANAPAGTINIRTKRAFDRRGGQRISAQISGTTHSNMWDSARKSGPGEGGYGGKKFLPNAQVEYSNVFFDRRLGVVFSASVSNMYVEQEQTELSRNYVPTALSPDPLAITAINLNLYQREISRFSTSLTMDFKASENLSLSLVSLYNEASIWAATTSIDFTTGSRTRGVVGDPVFDITTQVPATSNTLSIQNQTTYKDGTGRTFIPSFEYDNGRVRVDGALSYSNSISTYDPQGLKDTAYTMSAITARGNFSAEREAGDLKSQAWNIRQLSGLDWSDPNSFTGPASIVLRTNSNLYAEHTSTGGMLNMTFSSEPFSVPIIFKTGLKAQRREYEYSNPSDLNRYTYSGPLTRAEILSRIKSDNQYSFADTGINITTLNGSNEVYVPSNYKLLQLYKDNPEHWTATAATSAAEWYSIYVGNNRHFREDTLAAYAMGTASLGEKLKIRAGLRWERTETGALEHNPLSVEAVKLAGYQVCELPATTVCPVARIGQAETIDGLKYQYQTQPKIWRKGEYDYFFPSASVKYSFDDKTDLQFGYSRTIRRPEVAMLSGVWRVSEPTETGQGRITVPNPSLEPEISDNVSVRLARYFEPVGMVAINYYRNRVKGLFQTQELSADEFGYTGEEYADYLFSTTTTVDGDAIDIQGYELEFSHAMDYLPSPLDGLSVRGALMVNDPEVRIIRSADKIATFSVSYRKGPAKLYFNSVWTDEKYRTTTPSWFAAYWDANLSGSYRFPNGWESFFSVRNLLNRNRNVIVPGSLAKTGQIGDHSAIYIHGGMNTTIGLRARF
ncbi:MAG: TonB-dependent receptor [Asticcacaulis sp.]